MNTPPTITVNIPTDFPRLAPRKADGHKGTYGRVLLIGGSLGMSGSISLSAMAALRSGAGLVHVAVPKSILPTVAGFDPCYMTIPCEEDSQGRLVSGCAERLIELAEQSSCVVLGPGLGRSAEVTKLVKILLEKVTKPMLLDADALFATAQLLKDLEGDVGVRILTPHGGEFLRLCQPDVQKPKPFETRDMERAAARALAKKYDVTVVLKGNRTFMTDGRKEATNTTGNPGMATGGTGDVLSGVIGGLIGQMDDHFSPVRLGVFVHGLAGDLAAAKVGQVSLVASDLISYLSKAFMTVK